LAAFASNWFGGGPVLALYEWQRAEIIVKPEQIESKKEGSQISPLSSRLAVKEVGDPVLWNDTCSLSTMRLSKRAATRPARMRVIAGGGRTVSGIVSGSTEFQSNPNSSI
jgi:hypothetical protein